MLASITATSANNQQPPTQTILSFLKQYVQTDTEPKSAAEQEEDTMEQLSDILDVAEQPSTSYGAIPVFHHKLCSNNVLGQLQLDDVWFCLLRHATVSASTPDESRLHYDDFCQAGTECLETLNLPAVQPYFTATVFLKMTKDAQGLISVPSFHHYVVRRNAMLQTMIHMGCFDDDGDGALLDSQLQSYIAALVPEVPALQGLQVSMPVSTYAQMAARKFLFFLGKKGKVRIRDIVMSPMWYELMELRAGAEVQPPQEGWFSASSAERVRNMFLHLDQDRNNHLSKREFGSNTVGSFSQIFLDRLHEEHVTSTKHTRANGCPNQMDFGAFLDFMLAWENRASPAGLAYFMPVLDLKGRGYLTQADIHIYLREIYKMWVDCGLYPELNMEDVKDEIFDMAQPEDPLHITSQDLQKCGMASTIIGMLVDVNLFWEYDNRETLMQRDKEEQGN